MKTHHLVAIGCFVVAGALYYVSGATEISGWLFGLGLLVELAGWKNLFKSNESNGPGSN